MEELIQALGIVQNDVLLLEYKLKTYRWNVIGNRADDLRNQLISMIDEVSAAAGIIAEHIRNLVSPMSPGIDLTTIGNNSSVHLDLDGLETTYTSIVNKIKSDNNAILQSLSTARIVAVELGNQSETVTMIDGRISAHQAHANMLNSLN